MKLFCRLCLILILFTGCGVFVHHLTPQDLAWFDVYKKGDILVFQNITTSERDTTWITIRQVYHDYDWYLHSEFSHHRARLGYENKSIEHVLGSGDRQGTMFFINKQDKNDTRPYSLSYLNSDFTLKDTIYTQVSLTLSPKNFDKVYQMPDNRKEYRFTSEKHDYDPETLYWDPEYGIIKYIAYNGQTWERINWKD